MKIEISNIESLITEKIKIKALELRPNSKLKITLNAELPWCPGEEYSSYGVFISNEKGEVDLDLIEPIEGTYKANDSMGLIYSLKKTRSVGKNIAENISIDKPMIIHMLFEASDEKKEINLKRIFKTDDVIEKHICEDGFNGELFYKENSKDKLILMLGGSDGNMSAIKLMAAPLATRGIYVLMVPYFATEGLPKKLEEVPLEYFEKIFKWIESNKIVSSKEIFIHGTSKGGELALLLASRYKQIKKVVAVEPHAYCFQALNGMNCENMVSSWSFMHKSIPFIEIDNNIFLEDQKKAIENGVAFGFASSYKKSLKKQPIKRKQE